MKGLFFGPGGRAGGLRTDTHVTGFDGNSLVLESLLTPGKCVYVVVKCTYQTAGFRRERPYFEAVAFFIVH